MFAGVISLRITEPSKIFTYVRYVIKYKVG